MRLIRKVFACCVAIVLLSGEGYVAAHPTKKVHLIGYERPPLQALRHMAYKMWCADDDEFCVR